MNEFYIRDYDGPQPTAEEELRHRGRRSLLGIVCASLLVIAIMYALAALL